MKPRSLLALGIAACAIALGGCATTAGHNTNGDSEEARVRNVDPLEPLNRVSYRIHRVGDRFILRPIARGYLAVTPQPLRRGISNFFSNLGMPVVILNDLLQGKFSQAVDDTGRFVLNTTVGLGGLFDVASRAGLERPDEDFGQTLAVWGVPSGPYLFIPFLGPTNIRDGVGRVADGLTHPLYHYNNTSVRDKLVVLYAVQTRAALLSTDSTIESAADPYAFIRDAYMQRREFLIHDGQPPDDGFYDMYDVDDLDDLDDLEEMD